MSAWETLTPEEQAAREAVRSLPRPEADDAYRARLREAFVRGGLHRRLAAPPPRIARLATWAPLAAAAALAVAAGVMNRGPDWQVAYTKGDGMVIVGERPVPLKHADELARLLRRGGHVRVPDTGYLDLVAPGQLAVCLAPGADVRLPAAPNRWWRRDAQAAVDMGDAFFETGRGFHGATLEVNTAEARAHVTGTSFAVLRDAEAGTCVCVMEGRVRVDAKLGGSSLVAAGMRRVCPPDTSALILPILDYSVHALHKLREVTATRLER